MVKFCTMFPAFIQKNDASVFIYFFSLFTFMLHFLLIFLLVKWPFSNSQKLMTLHRFAEVSFLGFVREVIYIALLQLKEGILKSY